MPSEVNPYAAARREFVSTFGDLARGKRNWQLAAFGLLVLLGFVLAAYVRLSLQSRITPYVVEVDRLGQAVAFGPAEALRPTDTRAYVYQLALFVRDLRSVSSDPEAQRQMLFTAYAYAAGAARAQLDAWFLDPAHDPRVLGRTLTREVQVTSVLRVAGTASRTWKVSWREVERPRVAGPLRSAAWEAYLTTDLHAPTTTETLLRNPLGLYVTDLSWSEVTTGDRR
jgi:type IV secretory pathway TrbF-like protein